MKYFFLLSAFLTLFSGCSSKNAFSEFKMSKDQQLSVSNLQSSKITSEKMQVSGVMSAIYLNDIYPDFYNDKEYFFVYTYIKESQNLSAADMNIKLNSKSFIELRELPKENRFSNMVSNTSRWNKYYIATFEKDNSDKLELILESGDSSSSSLIYRKVEE